MPQLNELGMQQMEKVIRKVIREDTQTSIIQMDVWDWLQGVGLFALYRYYKEKGDKNILHYLTEWFRKRLREVCHHRMLIRCALC